MRLLGRIRVLSAEGKMSATVLVVLPFVIVFGMAVTNPTYLPTLLNDPIGNILMAISLGMMIAGILVMKKMITIKV
jgi:tight adherence protein B